MQKTLLVLFLTSLVCSAKQPNILFIAVDDLRPEMGVYRSRAITPNIDRLAAKSLRFDRAYCNRAVCGASRILLGGRRNLKALLPSITNQAIGTNLTEDPGETTAIDDAEQLKNLSAMLKERVVDSRE